VLEAAVIGVPDEKWGEVVVAYIQPRPGVTVDLTALRELCARSLTGFKRPTEFFVVEAIAKNAVGKIDKASLRAAHVAAS
jgi:long-chain acyl-CoA synthetase